MPGDQMEASQRGFLNMSKRNSDDNLTQSMMFGPPVSMRQTTQVGMKGGESEIVRPDDAEVEGDVTGRQIFFMRCGERSDRLYPEWTRLSFASGRYKQIDLNMPIAVPKRPFNHFKNDSPITEIGHVTARMVGRALALNRYQFVKVYSSPALRCVSTANAVIKGGGAGGEGGPKINVEPGLFECLGLYRGCPTWMEPAQLATREVGYPVDPGYTPIIPANQLNGWGSESVPAFHERIKNVLTKINETAANVTLIVTHAAVMDSAHRSLREKNQVISTLMSAEKLGVHYPLCSTFGLEEMSNMKWHTVHNAIPNLNYTSYSSQIDYSFYNR